jgi:pyruvate dehydrogenase E2 component (dihydrolipoamide acetyltransferase)
MANPIVMPRLGDFMTEGTISKWNKAAGEGVEQGEVIAEIESEKLNYQLEAGGAGILHRVAGEGEVVPVDGIIAYLLAEGEAPPAAADAAAPATAAPRPGGRRAPARQAGRRGDSNVPSTPGARRLAASLDVEISQVTPTGPRGRVTEGDVRIFAGSQQASPAKAGPRGLPEPASSAPLSGMRKSIADHMRSSLSNTAQLSFFMELDVTEAQRLRKEASSGTDVTLSIAHVLTKACAGALKRYPVLNSVMADGQVLTFDDVNVGVAVSLREGLVVPVVRGADAKSIEEIARETTDLAERARTGSLGPDEVLGGTFTISVLGSVDGFTPILNAGQSAILGVGKSTEKPVVRNGEIVVRELITVSLTVDHQVVDGAVAAGFMRRLQQLVEQPAPLFK